MDFVPLRLLLVIFGFLTSTIQGANILVFLPLGTWSHYMQYELLFETLAARGHHITMYSPFPPKQNLTNFNHVHVQNQAFDNIMNEFDAFRDCKDLNWFLIDTYDTLKMSHEINQEVLEDPKFRQLVKSKQSFDLVMVEPFFMQEVTVVLGHIFNAPVIHLAATGPYGNILEAMGSPNIVSFMPEIYSYLKSNMSLVERIQNFHYTMIRYVSRQVRNWFLDRMIEQNLGPGVPPLDSLLRNISMCFLYAEPALEYSYPMSPNMVQLAGIHLQRNKTLTLSEDLKKTLDAATNGFILFSLGSVITPKTIPPELLNNLLQVFTKLSHLTILWKWSGQPLSGLPRNVVQQKWVPQVPVLAHPNCKLFITHGGLSSQLETVTYGVPVVTIPFFADQFSNAMKGVEFGFGVFLKITNLTSEALEWAITTVIGDPRYKEQAMARSRILKDRLRSPLDTAVYWTEYVLQHEGALHLSPVSRHLYWFQYYLLDVLAFILAVLMVAYLLIRKILKETRPHLCNTSVSYIKEDHQKTDNIVNPRRAFGEHSLECFYPVHTSQF
ncbi:hypothetical protein M8J75_006741 [Diaphorina citri]|nr:hypothetical protein M8J75_006741 [Diaphorina citri]